MENYSGISFVTIDKNSSIASSMVVHAKDTDIVMQIQKHSNDGTLSKCTIILNIGQQLELFEYLSNMFKK
jgi:hypothetical protein